MVWLPLLRVLVWKVAMPLTSVPVPSTVDPCLNVTVPVAAEGEIVAVKVTDEPNVDGFAEEASATVVFALLTVCVRSVALLPLKLLSPLYAALIVWLPTVANAFVNVACPEALTLTLVDERALSMTASPFRSIQSLADYIDILIIDTRNG